jgi:phosphohistidine phosphatase
VLWLLRHSDAAPGHPDDGRPLTPLGISQSEVAGLAMRRLGIKLDTCLSSPKRRTMETAVIACRSLELEVVSEPALAGSDWDASRLAAGHGDVLLVGHNPRISTVVRDLTGARVELRKGGLAGIDGNELVVLLTPTELGIIAGITETVE